MNKRWGILPLMICASAAQAHVGHGNHMSVLEGLQHPLGFDHLLAMLAVGLWSARALKGKMIALAPLAFMLSLVFGALFAHQSGGQFADAELLISVSVLAFAGLILMPNVSKSIGFLLIVSAGLVHGWAHGMEASANGLFSWYVSGFVGTTAVLHALGVLTGVQLLKLKDSNWQWRGLSAAIAGYGLYALTMVL